MAASRFRALYDSGASVDHQALKASLDCCLASRRRWASDGMAPGGSGCKQPALARPSASSLPGMSVCPGIQRTCTFPCKVASSWNLVNLSCEESAGSPRRQLATARLSVQTTTSLVVSPKRRRPEGPLGHQLLQRRRPPMGLGGPILGLAIACPGVLRSRIPRRRLEVATRRSRR